MVIERALGGGRAGFDSGSLLLLRYEFALQQLKEQVEVNLSWLAAVL